MADDRMKHQDKNLGGKTGSEGQGGQYGGGQQAPGRNPQDDQSTGRRPGQGDRENQSGREDEDFDIRPGQGQGGMKEGAK